MLGSAARGTFSFCECSLVKYGVAANCEWCELSPELFCEKSSSWAGGEGDFETGRLVVDSAGLALASPQGSLLFSKFEFSIKPDLRDLGFS